MDVDPQFRQSRAASQRRRRERRLRFAATAGAIAIAVSVVVVLAVWLIDWTPDPEPPVVAGNEGLEGDQIVQVEDEAAIPAVRLSTPFVDIAGDPMILRFDTGDVSNAKPLIGPAELDTLRFGAPRPERLQLIVEDLVVQESRLVTALPSSREDFAFFQAQRSQSLATQPNLPAIMTAPEVATGQGTEGELVVVTDDDNSWGEALGGDADEPLTYINTRIQNTTSIAFVRPEAGREAVYSDLVVRLERNRTMAEFLGDNGFAEEVATRIDSAATELLPKLTDISTDGALNAGTIIAVRHGKVNGAATPLQLSIYGVDGYAGTLFRAGTLDYTVGTNPWYGQDLQALSSPLQTTGGQVQDFRLLDAVYSAVIRNGVPTNLVGELIVMLSQAYDLEAVAAPGDQVTLVYASGRGDGPGQIAFAGITGPSGEMPCYVALKTNGGAEEFACFTPRGLRGGSGGGAFVTPVEGTLSSPYGPRFHPILKEVRLHGGVDWAAPTGTPVVSALDGRVAVAGNGGGYGNVVYVDHDGGLQSRYAHLDAFAPNLTKGQMVRAGELIGYVGTTGRSTGPHLHFEIRRNGAPIDPFSLGQGTTLAASDAVEALTDQIIRVESAGNANAQNPLSTATGLGQFIESTWLRMMRDYRPDLHGTMSRPELLALRTDPTLSREMVQNLARENENFLRARGHQIDAGRLYLAHFLGPAGANTVLSSPEDQTILAVMGANVVRANPFLKDYTVADLKAWAQRKMRGVSGGASVPRPAVLPPEVRDYITQIDALLAQET